MGLDTAQHVQAIGARAGSAWTRDGFEASDSSTVPTGKGLMRQGQAPPSSATCEGVRQQHQQFRLETFRLEIKTRFFP